MHKKAPVVVLFGRVVWCIGDFFKSYLPEAMKHRPDSTKDSYTFIEVKSGLSIERNNMKLKLDLKYCTAMTCRMVPWCHGAMAHCHELPRCPGHRRCEAFEGPG